MAKKYIYALGLVLVAFVIGACTQQEKFPPRRETKTTPTAENATKTVYPEVVINESTRDRGERYVLPPAEQNGTMPVGEEKDLNETMIGNETAGEQTGETGVRCTREGDIITCTSITAANETTMSAQESPQSPASPPYEG